MLVMQKETNIVLANKKTNVLYKHLGGDMYQNLQTKQKGQIKDEAANKIFLLPTTINAFIQENPLILELMQVLNNGECLVKNEGEEKKYKF